MNQNHEVSMIQSMYANQNFSSQQLQQQQPSNVPVQQHGIPTIQNAFAGQEPQNNNQQHFQQNFNLPPPSFAIPDFSRPPPGFNSANVNNNSNETNTANSFSSSEPNEEVNLTPTMPYFDLPSGLIVPLIRLEDFSYHSIDPEKIQLPPPSMPTEKLLSAIEAFYAPPSHDRPRNEGWEKLGLYEYFKIKNAVRKQKEEAIIRFEREKSKSPSPIPDILIRPMKKIRKRVYRSQSPDIGPKSRSTSSSPETKIIIKSRRQRSKSPSRSPPFRFNRDSRNNRDSKADRMINRKRSISPPILPSFSVASNKSTEFIDEGNKGHLMLKKMGWESGGGLGLIGNQGITQPISGGEVRDRSDLYKVISILLIISVHFF
jgi:calcium homeostasis ER protein